MSEKNDHNLNIVQQEQIKHIKLKLEDLSADLKEGFQIVHLELKDYRSNFVQKDHLNEALSHRDSKIKNLEENQRWLARAIILFVILGVLGAFITFKL